MNSATLTIANARAAAARPGTTQEFLEAIIPGGAHIVTAILRPDGTMVHSFSPTHAHAAAIIAAATAKGLTAYHACAAYGPIAGGRKGDNVLSVGALWLDVDVGPGKPYAKKSEAATALLMLVKSLGMPQPMVVNSGNGLHAYWRLASPVTPAEWLPVARSLKAAAVAFGLGADPTRTADVASILRPVGSFNLKDPANPRPVLLALPGDPPEELTHYHTILGVEADVLADRPAHIPPGAADNSDFSAGDLGRQDQAQVDDVLAVCGQLRIMRDAPDSQGYAAWYGTLGILAYCEGGDDLAHEWGAGHPGYRQAQTQKFLDKWRTLSGGSTCAKLKADNPDGCAGCQFTGKSPLGAPRQHAISNTHEQVARDQGILLAAALAAPPPSTRIDYDKFDVSVGWGNIPPRSWLMGTILVRGEYTILASPGGRGKSALSIGLALSAAIGKDLLYQSVKTRLNIGVINFEDSRDEIMRRCAAFAQHHKIGLADMTTRLAIVGSGDLPVITLNKFEGQRAVVDHAGIAALGNFVAARNLDVLVIDPLSHLCPAGLNDNAVMASVMAGLKHMAQVLNCAILIVHHTRKGSSYGGTASAEDASGAAAITNHARIALSVEHFEDDEAKSFGILPADKWQFIKLHSNKSNMAVKGEPVRYVLSSVLLPNGDDVQAVELFVPRQIGIKFSDACLRDVLCCIAAGLAGQAFSSSKAASQKGYRSPVATILRHHFPNEVDKTLRGLADDALAAATTQGWLTTVRPQGGRKTASPTLTVVWSATPWATDPAPGPFVQ